ncbi:MAG: tRNA (adenosine(37)-N6)-dimethylallyltransferase MiaA [Candidatus Eisenbacteria bacterium]|nr:tRNA (adenosine(37)-N6)-dimethylallyltransferase MiaA [Candidatus Eisenbacteria bacterium]
MNDPILALVGPTASGKTEVGILLAERLDGEILSADARQVYRRLDIGTAKPSAEERARAAHHLLDLAEPDETFHAGRYVREAERVLAEVCARGRLPIVVGGTGLYIRALLRGLDVRVGRRPEIRAELRARFEREGSRALHVELARVDPESAVAIHPNDEVRIARALEIYLASGETRSEQHRRARGVRHDHRLAGLDPPRTVLFRRIDERFDRMIASGFLEEVRELLASGFDPDLPCFRSPGYRELLAHLRGTMSLEEATLRAKRETRRLAKRQMTWFRSEDVRWFDPTEEGGAEEAAARIASWFGEGRTSGS